MKLRAPALALLAALAATAALGVLPAPPSQAKARCSKTVAVKIGDADDGSRLFFGKAKLTVRAGQCVRWVWTGVLDHGVGGPGFRSKQRSAPFTYRKRFRRAHAHPLQIICTIHSSMRMKITVKKRS